MVGYAAASLRGLGSARTLVLLNGKRLATTAFSGTAVDLNAIPLAAIERVEILTDGASAIYGTDAIAGVINFILRQDFIQPMFRIFRQRVGKFDTQPAQARRTNRNQQRGDSFTIFAQISEACFDQIRSG